MLFLAELTGWRKTPHQLCPSIYPYPTDGLPDEILKLRYGEVKNPRVQTVQALHDFFEREDVATEPAQEQGAQPASGAAMSKSRLLWRLRMALPSVEDKVVVRLAEWVLEELVRRQLDAPRDFRRVLYGRLLACPENGSAPAVHWVNALAESQGQELRAIAGRIVMDQLGQQGQVEARRRARLLGRRLVRLAAMYVSAQRLKMPVQEVDGADGARGRHA